MILEKDLDFICDNGNYKNDGLIIVPLNGLNEIKMKPKSLMTIDLLQKNNKYWDYAAKKAPACLKLFNIEIKAGFFVISNR